MANRGKRISELTALTSASLDTTLVGVDNGTTYKVELDTLADAVTSRVNILDRSRLSALESVTSSYLTSLNGAVSSSSQLTSSYDDRYVISGSIAQTTWDSVLNKPNGIVSQSTDLSLLNSFTQSQDILNTAFTNGINARLQTSSFNEFSASIHSEIVSATNEQDLSTFATTGSNTFIGDQTISGSIIPAVSGAYDLGSVTNPWKHIYVNTGSIFLVKDAQIVKVLNTNTIVTTTDIASGSINISPTLPIGVISGSPQLTSSYDERYLLSGSITQTTWDNIDGKPDGLVSQSVDIADFSFTSNTIQNSTITIVASDGDIVLNADGNVYKGSSNAGNGFVTDGYLGGVIGDTNRVNNSTGNTITDNLDGIINSIPSISLLNTFTSSQQVLNNTFATAGSNTFIGNQTINGVLTILTPSAGVPNGVSNWNGGGGWNQSSYTNLTTTGGTGTGLTVDVTAEGSGYIDINTITINTPGSGYTNGDVITIDNENNIPGTFTISIENGSGWEFNTSGSLTTPGDINVSGSIYADNLDGLISSSQQILDLGFVTGSYTTINSFNSLTQSFNSISQSFTIISGSVGGVDFNGLISGSSQLTASYDNRYTLSGSSISINTGSFATTGSNTFIGTETISGSLLLSGSFSYNGTPLQNGFAFAQPQLTRILDNASYTGSSAWITSYNGNGGAVIVTANVSGYRTTGGLGTAQLLRDGVAVASQTFYFNLANYHTPLPSIVYVRNSETGSHTYSIYFNNILADTNDYATINVLEYGNSAMFPTTIISGSSQLTSSFDTRYTLSGSVVSGTTPTGTISGSSQLTSSFDGRYVQTGSFNTLTASFNSFTASAQAVTTGSNSFNGTQTITGSLIITTGSFVGSQILANTSSLYLTSGSNMYVQNNGVVEITGSLKVSGSAAFNVSALSVDGRGGDEGGEINLAIPVTNTTLQNRVTTDIWQNRFRVFEGSANSKGVFVDLSKAPAGVGGELMWKASGLVNLGVDVTLGDLKARLPSTGNKSLQLSTTSAGVTYSVYGSGIYTQAGSTVGTTINATSPLSVTSTPAYLASGYNFGTAGATDTWVIMDTSNTIAWRITMILGSGFNNNMISIERLV